MSSWFKTVNRRAGFSLVEMLISMVVFSVVMGIIYSFLLQTKKDLSTSEVELGLADNAQAAVNALRKDLYQIGIGRDSEKNQPQILRAGMFDLIFCADLDREIRNPEKRYGSPDHYNYSMPFTPGSPFLPLYFLYDNSVDESLRYSGWDPDEAYGHNNNGAEIVRYSLDSNGDNQINALDLEDNLTNEGTRQPTMNPYDFWLFKEWWGVVNTSGVYTNQHSGRHPVAFNVRGMFYKPDGGVMPETNKYFMYPDWEHPKPDGQYPKILFTYWGHFWNSVTANDDPTSENWDGEPIELWGDWGNQFPIQLDQPTTPDPVSGARDGVLDFNEINRLMSDSLMSQVNLIYLFHVSGRAGESVNGDENGNGIPGENRLDQFIRRIGVNIVVEADSQNPKSPNLEHSNLSLPTPVYYYYKDYEISLEINPRNLLYLGSPLIDMSMMTPTPAPPTSTPIPPTNTPDPSIPTNTPTSSPTPDPMATPTATPDAFGYDDRDGELMMGGYNFIFGRTISYGVASMSDVCSLSNGANYLALYGYPVTQIRSANFCDSATTFDSWNDVLFANNADNGIANLFYYKHNRNSSINGFSVFRSVSVGYNQRDRITSIAAGNLGTFGFVSTEYDEVVTAYHRFDGTAMEKSTLEIFALNAPCGDLLPSSNPAPLVVDTNRIIKDMVIADFDGDGLGELVTLSSHLGSEGIAQVQYYHDLEGAGWSGHQDFLLNFGPSVTCAKLVAGVVYTGSSKPVEPDLIVVAENGQYAVITNLRNAPPSTPLNPFSPTIRYSTSDAYTKFTTVTGAVVYDSNNFSSFYNPVLAICGNSNVTDNAQLVHYDLSNTSFPSIPLAGASGTIWPILGNTISTKGMAYVPVQGVFNINTYLAIPANVSGINYLIFLENPALSTTSLVDPSLNCQLELFSIIGGVNCLTSTRNVISAEHSVMPTPTPMSTP